jgi:long-chain acyl-CoA synthetase
VTGFPIVPTIAALILQMKDLAPGAYPHLRYITNTAAALPPAHIARLQELFPETLIFSMYGLTECKRCTWLPPAQLKTRPGSVGIAIPGTEAYVVGEGGRRAAPNEVGELVIRGAHVMKGYWEDEAATKRALKPGPFPWERVLHTGDLFRTDEEGFLYFVGRTDEMIKTSGYRVSPTEIEEAAYSTGMVRDAVALGIPEEGLGHRVVLAAAGERLEPAELLKALRRELPLFMVPAEVVVREELPRSPNGKFDRVALAGEVAAELAERTGMRS